MATPLSEANCQVNTVSAQTARSTSAKSAVIWSSGSPITWRCSTSRPFPGPRAKP